MCKIWTILFVLFSPLFSIGQLADNFSDSTLLNGPIWQGDIDSFEISNGMLHLNAPSQTQESYLATPFDGAVDGVWEFRIRLDFNPSSSNKALVYIMSDSLNLEGALNGYFVMIGNSQDEVSLYKQTATSTQKIIDGTDDLLSTNSVDVRIRVARDQGGTFELYADTSSAQNNWELQGVVQDNSFMQSSYFGILCDYTSTRSDKFWLDDVYSNTQEYQDLSAPQLLSYQLEDLHTIHLNFNEAIDSSNTLFKLNNTTFPQEINYMSNSTSLIFTQELLTNFQHELLVQLPDLYGNDLDTTWNFEIEPSAAFQELWINEIYADENPSFGMPAAEFVELYNRTGDTMQVHDWSFADANDTVVIPPIEILPEAYIILCKTSALQGFSTYGEAIGVPNFPSLNNTGDALKLLNEYGQLIDSISYNLAFYQGELDSLGNEKKSGGYSLERLPNTSTCSPIYHWYPSSAAEGASPGQANSVYSMSFPPTDLQVSEVIIENDTTLQVFFNTGIPQFNEQHCALSGNDIEQAFQYSSNSVYILLAEALEPSTAYELLIFDLLDCRAQLVPEQLFEFYYFAELEEGDLVINEVLFNPHTGGVDFIEVYNHTDKKLWLEGFSFIEYDALFQGEVKEQFVINELSIGPKELHVFTSDTSNIKLQYNVFENAWLHHNKIPNLPDKEGILVLSYPDGGVMDSLNYRASWHLASLDLEDGVSLERIQAEGLTNAKSNWHSAAKTYGYGTPTAQNSQTNSNILDAQFDVIPPVFTPNEDGDKDFCMIRYQADGGGQIANLSIFDMQGRQVRLLAQNHSVGTFNQWKWTGLTNEYERAPIGIYIALLEVFTENGKKQVFKEKLVLGTSFD